MDWTHLLSSRRTGQTQTPTESSRSAFEQDYDRVIFSHPFRRLQDKTQVHPLPEDDLVHTRLNLFDRKANDIEYWYASQLPGEISAQFDRHVHPTEPHSVRVTLQYRF